MKFHGLNWCFKKECIRKYSFIYSVKPIKIDIFIHASSSQIHLSIRLLEHECRRPKYRSNKDSFGVDLHDFEENKCEIRKRFHPEVQIIRTNVQYTLFRLQSYVTSKTIN